MILCFYGVGRVGIFAEHFATEVVDVIAGSDVGVDVAVDDFGLGGVTVMCVCDLVGAGVVVLGVGVIAAAIGNLDA